MKQYLITVKLPKNPLHNPQKKVTGFCPVNKTKTCTDVTGEHHTVLVTDPLGSSMNVSTADVIARLFAVWRTKYHVTRIEEV